MDCEITFEFKGKLNCNKLNSISSRHICTIDIHLKQTVNNFKLLVFQFLSTFLLEWMHKTENYIEDTSSWSGFVIHNICTYTQSQQHSSSY
jgi:phosphoribosylpyrophosphate synthetase